MKITYTDNKIKVWKTRNKRLYQFTSLVESGSELNLNELNELYIEGIAGTDSFQGAELKAEYVKGGNVLSSDVLKITVFEAVNLTGFFTGAQQDDNSKRHSTFGGSSNVNGIIIWDDPDENCLYFHNCMEFQATLKPGGITVPGLVEFDIKREAWARFWTKWDVNGEWEPYLTVVPWDDDDPNNNDEDLSPSGSNHIYSIDGPGWGSPYRVYLSYDHVALIADFRERVMIKIDGTWYQCSDFYKWKTSMYLKPKPPYIDLLTRDLSKPQDVSPGWSGVPDEPEN